MNNVIERTYTHYVSIIPRIYFNDDVITVNQDNSTINIHQDTHYTTITVFGSLIHVDYGKIKYKVTISPTTTQLNRAIDEFIGNYDLDSLDIDIKDLGEFRIKYEFNEKLNRLVKECKLMFS